MQLYRLFGLNPLQHLGNRHCIKFLALLFSECHRIGTIKDLLPDLITNLTCLDLQCIQHGMLYL